MVPHWRHRGLAGGGARALKLDEGVVEGVTGLVVANDLALHDRAEAREDELEIVILREPRSSQKRAFQWRAAQAQRDRKHLLPTHARRTSAPSLPHESDPYVPL